MAGCDTPGDAKRHKLRTEKAFHHLVLRTNDELINKPVKPKTESQYAGTLHEWEDFTKEYTQMYPGVPTPMNPKTAKSFLLFYKTGRKGRIEDAVTDSSADTFWKNFTSAWQRKPGEHFGKPLRDTILNFIHGGEDNLLSLSTAQRLPKNYTLQDFEAVSRQLWQNDWHDFTHELYRAGLHLLELLHCGASGRAGEFKRNLCFGPQIVIDLRWDKAKGLQNLPREQPEHVLYELVDQPFYYNVVLFFMARALAAGAFRHYKKWVDVCAIKKPSGRGHMILQFEDDALKAPIFPRYLANGSIDNT